MKFALKIELSYDPAIPLLDTYPKKTTISKDTCNPIFIALLFTIVRPWKQPEYPSIEEYIKKMWCISSVEYYSAVKRN